LEQGSSRDDNLDDNESIASNLMIKNRATEGRTKQTESRKTRRSKRNRKTTIMVMSWEKEEADTHGPTEEKINRAQKRTRKRMRRKRKNTSTEGHCGLLAGTLGPDTKKSR
jgi:hypothetical protein